MGHLFLSNFIMALLENAKITYVVHIYLWNLISRKQCQQTGMACRDRLSVNLFYHFAKHLSLFQEAVQVATP